jgi:hypothetical protein
VNVRSVRVGDDSPKASIDAGRLNSDGTGFRAGGNLTNLTLVTQNIFCDQNFLIAISKAGKEYQTRLSGLFERRAVNFVLGLWTLVEIARSSDELMMAEVAAAADGLQPTWLAERSMVQHHEVSERFFAYLGVPHQRPSIFRTLGEVAAELVQEPVPIGRKYSIVQLAGMLRAQMGTVNRGYEENVKVRPMTTEAWKKGWFTDKREMLLRKYVESFLPSETPAGIVVDVRTKSSFLDGITVAMFPSIAVEYEMFDDGMRVGTKLRIQTFHDRQHVAVALPYVHSIVTDDSALRRAVKRVAPRLPFPTAGVITRREFDRTFI